jgi:hypothetical protein
VTGLLLDLDDTLVDDRAAMREALRAYHVDHANPAAGLLGALEALGLTPPARIP